MSCMRMRVALDTNILVYFEGLDDEERAEIVRNLVEQLPRDDITIPVQALGELYNVLVRKAHTPRAAARDVVLGWTATRAIASANEGTFLSAIDLAATHQLVIWDAIIVATAADAGCKVLLSEEMHHGFAWGGVTVINPFLSPRHPLLDTLLRG